MLAAVVVALLGFALIAKLAGRRFGRLLFVSRGRPIVTIPAEVPRVASVFPTVGHRVSPIGKDVDEIPGRASVNAHGPSIGKSVPIIVSCKILYKSRLMGRRLNQHDFSPNIKFLVSTTNSL